MKNKPQRNVHLQASAPPQGKRLPVIGTWASERGGKVKVLFYTAIRVVREGEEEGYMGNVVIVLMTSFKK